MARRNGASSEIPIFLQEMLKSGLSLLWRSYEYTLELDPEGWEFAVGSDVLYGAGLSDIDLRWMIARGYVEFAPTGSRSTSQNRMPDQTTPGKGGDTLVLLTEAGAAFALTVISRATLQNSHVPPATRQTSESADPFDLASVEQIGLRQKPRWDRDRKELRCGEWAIKQFRWAAVNQETILMAFEEEEWPIRIDDPLPRKFDQDPKNRLHDTIKCLNRNHKKRMIRFHGDGTGEGILWTFLDGDGLDS